MSTVIFMVCCLILVVVPLVFVASKVYKDGFFGRCGLLGIAFSSATFLLEWFHDAEYEMLPQTVALVVSFTVFLCWHLFRFHNRVVMEKKAGLSPMQRPEPWGRVR
jgi:hypothetical protein